MAVFLSVNVSINNLAVINTEILFHHDILSSDIIKSVEQG